MKASHKLRRAFSLIELVFVIVVLGIVASLGSEIIAKVYEGYIVERAEYRANIKTELALNQIANRLRYAIPGTVVARQSATAAIVPITQVTNANNDVLQWVGYDGDSFEAITSASNRKPGWSGFCDLKASTQSTIATPGSNLSLANTIIGKLSGGTKGIADARIFFPDGSSYGVNTGTTGETLALDSAIPTGKSIWERYKLAWSSYALSVESGDLYLYYNFTPQKGATLGTTKRLLLKNVTNFRFKGTEGAIRIKICKEEKIGSGTVTSCKEKVVF